MDRLVEAYFDNDYNIGAMLRVLFNSDFFKSESAWYAKVKSPVELVAGVLRLTGEFDRPRYEIMDRYNQASYMGQILNNPPSVEGWHQGADWLDSGTLVERINFASQQIGDPTKPGIQAMVQRIENALTASPAVERAAQPTAETLVNACLEEIGALTIDPETRQTLINFADNQAIPEVLQMVAATQEFQRS